MSATGRPRSALLAEPQPLLRAGLRTVLAEHGLEVVAQAANAEEAVAEAERHHPGVCLLDADLPGGAILAVRRITQRVPDTSVVVLAHEITPDLLLAAVRAGADGVVSKSTPAGGLMRAVDSVLDGQTAIPRAALASLVHEFRGGGRTRTSIDGRPISLTDREAQVLELLRENLTTAQIARELEVSQVTVRRHVSAIATKAGERNGTALLRLVRVVA